MLNDNVELLKKRLQALRFPPNVDDAFNLMPLSETIIIQQGG